METVYVNEEDYDGSNGREFIRVFRSKDAIINPKSISLLWEEIKQVEAQVDEANNNNEKHDYNSDIFSLIHETFLVNSEYSDLVELREKIGDLTNHNKEPHELINSTLDAIDIWRNHLLGELIKSGFTCYKENKEFLLNIFVDMQGEFAYLEKNHSFITDSVDKYFIGQIAQKAHNSTTGKLGDYIEEVGMRKYFEGTEDYELFARAQILNKMVEVSDAVLAYKEKINSLVAESDRLPTSPCFAKLESITQTIPVRCDLKTKKIGHINNIDLLSCADITQLLNKHDALVCQEVGCDGEVIEVLLINNLQLIDKKEKPNNKLKPRERD